MVFQIIHTYFKLILINIMWSNFSSFLLLSSFTFVNLALNYLYFGIITKFIETFYS